MRLFDIQTAYLNRLSSLRLYFNLYIIIAKLFKLDLESPETNKHLLLAFIIKKICYSTDSSCYLILKMFINWFDKCVNRMSCYLCGFCYYWLLKWFAEWFYICKLYTLFISDCTFLQAPRYRNIKIFPNSWCHVTSLWQGLLHPAILRRHWVRGCQELC